MPASPSSTLGHSAKVQLWLECPGHRISLTHSATTYIITNEKITVPPCNALLIVHIDDAKFEHPIYLQNGINPNVRDTLITPREVSAA